MSRGPKLFPPLCQTGPGVAGRCHDGAVQPALYHRDTLGELRKPAGGVCSKILRERPTLYVAC